MSEVADPTARRPFHETIVDAIRHCSSPSTGEIIRLFRLIEETKIPKGHDEIIAAIDSYFNFPGANKWSREIREMKESILEQKKAAAQKADDVKPGTSLDDLNGQVTAAIFELEEAERKVSRLEEEIAKQTTPSSEEGRIARYDAVRAAMAVGDRERAAQLVNRFQSEDGCGAVFAVKLAALLLH